MNVCLSQDVWKIYQVVFSGALPLMEIQCQDHAEMLTKALGTLGLPKLHV